MGVYVLLTFIAGTNLMYILNLKLGRSATLSYSSDTVGRYSESAWAQLAVVQSNGMENQISFTSLLKLETH